MRRLLIAVGGLAGLLLALGAALALLLFRLLRPARPLPARPRPSAEPSFPTGSGLGRLTLVLVPALTLAGGVFFLTVGAPWLLARQHFPMPPDQPIYFSHEIHVQQVGLDCAFCHRTANRADTAGYPDVQQCMFCHIVVDESRAFQVRAAYAGQIDRLRDAWTERRPLDWMRIHRIPDHSRFPHDAHVQAGVTCSTCHGQAERMELVNQVRSLKMGDCVACHQQTGAPAECGACHY